MLDKYGRTVEVLVLNNDPEVGRTRYSVLENEVLKFQFELANSVTLAQAIEKIEAMEPSSIIKSPVRIYRYIPPKVHVNIYNPPKDINFITGLTISTYADRSFAFGEMIQVDWYSDFDMTELLVREEITYYRDVIGMADSRQTIRTWYREDGTPHPDQKISNKLYKNPTERIEEGKVRRNNVVNELLYNALGLMFETLPFDQNITDPVVIEATGNTFVKSHNDSITSFIQVGGSTELIAAFTNATDVWLDNLPASLGGSMSIRDYLIYGLTF